MSEHQNVRNLHTGPAVPDFQNQPREQPQINEQLLEAIIARTTQALQASRPDPFQLETFADIEAFAIRAAKSSFCPKAYIGKATAVDDIIMAILKGKEVGLPTMTAMQNISVVNGNPTIWGRAVAGLCISTGLVVDHREWWTGEAGTDSYTAHCEVTRRGVPTPTEGTFSYGDVRQASGMGPVHKTYPKDMCMWKARHRAWFTAFPDRLMGLGIAEIEQELAAIEAFKMPRPEMAWQRPPASSDGWDNSWIAAALEPLTTEPNAWKWLGILRDLMEKAPTLRDLTELEKLPVVAATMQGAPEEEQTSIAQAWVDNAKRFSTPPAETKAAPAKTAQRQAPATRTAAPVANPAQQDAPVKAVHEEPEEAPFEYAVLDLNGEPIDGEIHTDPLAWARNFAAIADPRTMGYLTLREHNADAMADARRIPEAAKIIDTLEAEADIRVADETVNDGEGNIPVIEPTLSRGKPDWQQYQKDLVAALAGCGQTTLAMFAEAQRARIEKFPQSARLAATKALAERCEALGVTGVPGFTAAAATAAPPADKAVTNGAPAEDKDRKTLTGILDQLNSLDTEYAVQQFSNQQTTIAVKKRWEREGRPELAQEMVAAFESRIASIKGT